MIFTKKPLLLFILILVNFLVSCQTKKKGFFNNSYGSYKIKSAIPEGNNDQQVEANIVASTNGNDQSIVVSEKVELIKTEKNSYSTNLNKKAPQKNIKTFSDYTSKILKKKKPERHLKGTVGKSSVPLWVLVLLGFLIPPLAVFFVDGISTPFWIDLVLTIIFWLPGAIYALLRIFR